MLCRRPAPPCCPVPTFDATLHGSFPVIGQGLAPVTRALSILASTPKTAGMENSVFFASEKLEELGATAANITYYMVV